MRFALMIEPQMGLTYDGAAGDRPARRGGRLRDPVPVRPLRELPGRRRAVTPPTPGPWSRASRGTRRGSASASLVSPVTFRTPGQPRQGRGHGGRDERRARRGGPGRRLARGRAPPPRVPVPGDRGAGGACSRRRWRSSTGCGTSPDGWSFTRPALRGGGRAVPARSRASLPGRDGRRPNILVGGQGTPRSFRIAARYADEFNLSSASPDGAAAEVRGSSTTRCRAAGREPSTLVHSAMAGVLIGRDAAEVKRRERGPDGGVRRRRRRVRGVVRDAPAALGLGTPDEARDGGPAVRGRRRGAADAPGLHPPRPGHDRPGRGGAVRT